MPPIVWIDGARPFVAVRGKLLEGACFGPGPADAPTVVMLHEGLGCVGLWRDFPPRLAEATGLGVFVFSRAGYGQSDLADLPRPLDYMTREAVEVLPAILNAIGVRQAVLLGHSDGATIAAIHAGTVRDPRVLAAVLIAPHFFTESFGLAEIARARETFATTDLKDRMARYHRDAENTFRGWNDAWLDPGFEAWNVEDALDTLAVPVLALQGREDQYGSLNQIEVVKRRAPGPVTLQVLEGCKHSPHLEQPDVTLAAVATFLAGLNLTGHGEARHA